MMQLSAQKDQKLEEQETDLPWILQREQSPAGSLKPDFATSRTKRTDLGCLLLLLNFATVFKFICLCELIDFKYFNVFLQILIYLFKFIYLFKLNLLLF